MSSTRKIKMLGLLSCVIFLAVSCSSQKKASIESDISSEPTSGYYRISATEAKRMLETEPSIILVDVRRPDEYEERHIPSAILIPNETISTTRPEQLPDLDSKILVYCRTGVRSKQASDKLVAMGYTQIFDMGGIVSWPFETVSGK